MVDASELGAIDRDVPFDWRGAERLKRALTAMADAIQNQRGARMETFAGGLRSWQGAARTAYDAKPRHVQCDTDAGELVAALRDAVQVIEALMRAARAEDDRRCRAREYVAAYKENEASENFGDDLHDFFFGEDFRPPPMPEPPCAEPHLTAPPGPTSDPRV